MSKSKQQEAKCSGCGSTFSKRKLKAFDNKLWCKKCLAVATVICGDCTERVYLEETRAVGLFPICDRCFENDYFVCDGCGEYFHENDYGEDGYCRYCIDNERSTICPDNKRYYFKSRWDLPVGVEIEAEQGDFDMVYDELAGKGFGVARDGSLNSSGIEIQVPASNRGNTEKLIQQACRSLSRNGFEVSRRCGLHVHIEYPSRMKTIKRLLLMIYACEPIFHAINPRSRFNNTFCQPLALAFKTHEITRTKPQDIDKLFYSKKHSRLTKSRIRYYKKSKWNECRYFGFNLHSLFHQKTVEFRYHAGTISPRKIIHWIQLLKAILLYVRFGYDQAEVLDLIEQPTILSKMKYLKKLLKLDGLLFSYLLNRYLKFRQKYVWHNLR